MRHNIVPSWFYSDRLPFFHKFVWNNFTWSQILAVFVDTHDWRCGIFFNCLSVEFLGVKYSGVSLLLIRNYLDCHEFHELTRITFN